jgi:hypothetical protein
MTSTGTTVVLVPEVVWWAGGGPGPEFWSFGTDAQYSSRLLVQY